MTVICCDGKSGTEKLRNTKFDYVSHLETIHSMGYSMTLIWRHDYEIDHRIRRYATYICSRPLEFCVLYLGLFFRAQCDYG